MLPYLATIVVLVLISRNAALITRQHAGVARQAVLPGQLTHNPPLPRDRASHADSIVSLETT